MRFWEDMLTKYGFNDGSAIPNGVEAYRAVYIRAVNQLAAQLVSQVRAVAFNRAGVHNFCLVLFHRLEDLQNIPTEQYTDHMDIPAAEVEPDEAMQEAVRQAYELHLDQYLQVTVEIDPRLDEFIQDLEPIDEDGPLIVIVEAEVQQIYKGSQVEVVSTIWLAEHSILPENNHFTVQAIYHRDEYVTLRSHDDRLFTAPAHILRVISSPKSN